MKALDTTASALALIGRWSRQGWLRALDAAFAGFLAREVPSAPPLLILAAALASHQLGRGHPCLDLEQTLRSPDLALSLPPEGARSTVGDPAPLPSRVLQDVTCDEWLAALAMPELVGKGPGTTPLVVTGSRVYLRRYWQYEQSVRAAIDARLAHPLPVDAALLGAVLAALFPAPQAPAAPGPASFQLSLFPSPAASPPTAASVAVDWQRLGCALATRSAFTIITGGPGTGKTTTVVRLLAVLQALALAATPGRPLRMSLAAPTGKAAARLSASIARELLNLRLDCVPNGEAIRAGLSLQATTLHRLLGSRPDTRRFRHDAADPLPIDVLVVDEASMIDLEMLAAVLAALSPTARLVLLGDKDQLASVEAGAVLGELCRRADGGHYTPATAVWIDAVGGALPPRLVDPAGTPLDQAVAMLRHSYRFGEDSGIGRLAKAVNAGDAAALRRVLDEGCADLAGVRVSPDAEALRRLVVDGATEARPVAAADAGGDSRTGYRHYLALMRDARPGWQAGQAAIDAWASQVLAAHRRFQLLSPLRGGPWGVEELNPRIAAWLASEALIAPAHSWYAGRPVLVTRNDYGLGLMNGDIGIALELPARAGEVGPLRVAFPATVGSGSGEPGIKWVQPSRLQAVETVFALTVHKAQGSEFEHAALVLPDTGSPILTRELIYTGITRASRWFTLVEAGEIDVLDEAVQRRVLRLSGLLA